MADEAILVVDDNAANLRLAELLLSEEGYDVRTAGHAEEALLVLETFEPWVILMDVQLPGIDGLELTRLLKSQERTKHIAILALTADAMKGDEERMLRAGCDGYVPKPLDVEKLPPLIAEIIEKRRGKP